MKLAQLLTPSIPTRLLHCTQNYSCTILLYACQNKTKPRRYAVWSTIWSVVCCKAVYLCHKIYSNGPYAGTPRRHAVCILRWICVECQGSMNCCVLACVLMHGLAKLQVWASLHLLVRSYSFWSPRLSICSRCWKATICPLPVQIKINGAQWHPVPLAGRLIVGNGFCLSWLTGLISNYSRCTYRPLCRFSCRYLLCPDDSSVC